MADDYQSPINLDFRNSRCHAAADVSNATLMLTKSIYSVRFICPACNNDEIIMPAAGAVCSLYHLSENWSRRYGLLCGEVNIIGFDGSGAIIAYFVNKKDFLC